MAANPVGGGGATPTTAAASPRRASRGNSPIPETPTSQRRGFLGNVVNNIRRAVSAVTSRFRRNAAGGPASTAANAPRTTR